VKGAYRKMVSASFGVDRVTKNVADFEPGTTLPTALRQPVNGIDRQAAVL
jgi:hypothetical protein